MPLFLQTLHFYVIYKLSDAAISGITSICIYENYKLSDSATSEHYYPIIHLSSKYELIELSHYSFIFIPLPSHFIFQVWDLLPNSEIQPFFWTNSGAFLLKMNTIYLIYILLFQNLWISFFTNLLQIDPNYMNPTILYISESHTC